jgi:molybdenum cofactor cytidylyltransferase
MGEISAIVLAAGTSRRFGSDKLLHPVRRNGVTLPLAVHSLLPWLEVHKHITVVVKPNAQLFCHTLKSSLGSRFISSINWVVCADASQGMAYSISRGVQANAHAAGWVIGLADMPAVPPSAIAGVRQALLTGASLAAPDRDGRRGHPVGFSPYYREELISLSGDIGAREIIERDRDKMVRVHVDDGGIFTDIDTPADLQRL